MDIGGLAVFFLFGGGMIPRWRVRDYDSLLWCLGQIGRCRVQVFCYLFMWHSGAGEGL